MSILSRLTLEGLSVKRTLGQSYAHLGDTIELAYELTNDHSLGKLWLEVFEKSNWPEPLPGRVLSIGGRKTRKWKVLAKATGEAASGSVRSSFEAAIPSGFSRRRRAFHRRRSFASIRVLRSRR